MRLAFVSSPWETKLDKLVYMFQKLNDSVKSRLQTNEFHSRWSDNNPCRTPGCPVSCQDVVGIHVLRLLSPEIA